MKKILLVIGSVVVSALVWGTELTGHVKTDTQAPVAGAVVSDGYSVVTTDGNGAYTMPYTSAAAFVFVSVPSGYDFPVDNTGFTKIWQRIDKNASTHQHDFTLHKQEDGGKADSSHVLLVFGDPQILNAYDMWRFRNETIEDVKQLTQSYPAGTKFIGLTVGDIVWDEYAYFDDQKANYVTMGFPNFMVIGNHDHNCGAAKQVDTLRQDSVASLLFEEEFGPTYYSFNVGNVHYVVLDNILYYGYRNGGKGYATKLTEKQKNWLKKDMAQLKKGTQVVYAMHSIGTNFKNQELKLLNDLAAPLGCENYLMSGHVHTNSVLREFQTFIEHNIGACQGSFWSCDWSADGSPNGYKVFEASPEGICNWYFKGTGWNSDFRIKTFPVNSINTGNKSTSVIANIWDFVDGETVQVQTNIKLRNMSQWDASPWGYDPDLYDLMLKEDDLRPNYPGEGAGMSKTNPGAETTKHLFTYKPRDGETEFEVVYTNRFGEVFKAPILNHQMVASFSKDSQTGQWSYQQDFDHLPSYPNYSPYERRGTWVAGHTPKGWYAANSGNALPSEGSVTWSGYDWLHIDNGGQNIAWVKSFGSTCNTPAENGRERSLGSLNLAGQKRISYGVIIENNTGSAFTGLNISYTGEVWRVGASNTSVESLDFSYAILTDEEARKIRDREKWIGEILTTAAPELSFTTPDNITAKTSQQTNTAIDGNNPQNQRQITGTITLPLLPGQVVLLRWDDDLKTSDKDQALAIDDVKIVPTFTTDLPEYITSLRKRTEGAKVVWENNQVKIITDDETYSINGSRL